jgi:IMP dehydrogenase
VRAEREIVPAGLRTGHPGKPYERGPEMGAGSTCTARVVSSGSICVEWFVAATGRERQARPVAFAPTRGSRRRPGSKRFHPYNGDRPESYMRIQAEALTFDDVLLQPAYSEVLPRQVNLTTRLTSRIVLNIPLLSAAMDTVTESKLAIALAQEGGIGIVHKNMTAERQASEVRAVKKYESGVITDPITVPPNLSIGEVLKLTRANRISGVPVVDRENLVGIVTSRDLRFETRYGEPVSIAMTPKERLVTVKEGASREEVIAKLHQHRIEKVLVVSPGFQLRGMITVKDIQKSSDYPLACKDDRGRLRVGAAVGTGPETEGRIAGLVAAGVDVVVVDTAHGHSRGVIDRVAAIKRQYPDLQVIGGNIATAEAALALADAGADAVKVGIGPGSICTTRIVAGVGVPQISAVMAVAEALRHRNVPLISDGGVRYSGDFSKALAAGAHAVMVGSMLAGTEEAPGEVELYQGRSYKSYRGMGSLGAMSQAQGSKDRYFQDTTSEVEKLVPEGVEGRVPYKGPMAAIVHQMIGGLRASMGYTGCSSIEELRTKTRFVKITSAGIKESHVHDVTITKEAPNYRTE